jgi:hypothetical protein
MAISETYYVLSSAYDRHQTAIPEIVVNTQDFSFVKRKAIPVTGHEGP